MFGGSGTIDGCRHNWKNDDMTEHVAPSRPPREYDDIPGTYVFDGRHNRMGYALNMFCMSLNQADNRDAFRTDDSAYLDRFELSAEQRTAVKSRDWLDLLRLGGNIYYTFKLAIFDGLSMQRVGGEMSGITEEEFAAMMVAGGRSIEGNRFKSDGFKPAAAPSPTGLKE
jgi:protocatechuate 4,5-dioxygenase alpha chain